MYNASAGQCSALPDSSLSMSSRLPMADSACGTCGQDSATFWGVTAGLWSDTPTDSFDAGSRPPLRDALLPSASPQNAYFEATRLYERNPSAPARGRTASVSAASKLPATIGGDSPGLPPARPCQRVAGSSVSTPPHGDRRPSISAAGSSRSRPAPVYSPCRGPPKLGSPYSDLQSSPVAGTPTRRRRASAPVAEQSRRIRFQVFSASQCTAVHD